MKFIRNVLILLVVLMLVAAGVVALFPARTAVEWLSPRLGAVKLEEVTGTIWKGQAARFSVRNQHLGALGWSISPRSLLHSALIGEVRLLGDRFEGESKLHVTGPLSGEFKDLRLVFPAELLNPALDIPGLLPVGKVEVQLTDVKLVMGYPQQLDGKAIWRNAAVAGEAAASFGDLNAEFRSVPGGKINGVLGDNGGNLSLEGTFELGATGYEAEAILAARDGNPDVIKALGWIGEQQSDGSSILKVSGRLLPLR
ncbi:type II secretion system protein N [Pseudomarimonas arenosa]|uniref:Type II secretion system protein N n=1 Tax=Pseudomarimonas arenosa TaxID=2774145 RepID=A0AAW3ZLM9_9GAMM|nr:type II secretion system protein N [Pseudomarimonas arenosa]MBD8525554.1 type II secretion system protein N [Pseudomarimonas arenosa]